MIYSFQHLFMIYAITYGASSAIMLLLYLFVMQCYDKVRVPIHLPIPLKYEDKYIDKYENLENTKITRNTMKRLEVSFVSENTPQGIIWLTLDIERQGFKYYANKTNIQYKYLEVLARKFCISCNCKSLYIPVNHDIEEKGEDGTIKTNVKQYTLNKYFYGGKINEIPFFKPKPKIKKLASKGFLSFLDFKKNKSV